MRKDPGRLRQERHASPVLAGTRFHPWADIYIRQGDDLQARVYLNNLKNNYKGDDEIAAMIEDRLGKLKQ